MQILCAKYFLPIHLFGKQSAKLSIYYVNIIITNIVAYDARSRIQLNVP